MILQGNIGPAGATTASLGLGTPQTLRLGNMGDTIVSELHGRYYEAVYRRTLFTGATQAVVATQTVAGLTASTTGVPVLYNPIGNTMNLVLNKVGIANLVAPALASVIGIATGYNASTAVSGTLTSVTPKNRFIGLGASPTGLMYFSSAITLPTIPTLDIVIGTITTAVITTAPVGPAWFVDLEGSIILPPGAYATIYTSTALAASSLLASFSWEEVAV
jgi:hypothetical protein